MCTHYQSIRHYIRAVEVVKLELVLEGVTRYFFKIANKYCSYQQIATFLFIVVKVSQCIRA